jgi:SAM-dependent methyltransferase
MSAIGVLHEKLVFNRRVETLAGWFAQLAPPSARVLDVGCGDGLIDDQSFDAVLFSDVLHHTPHPAALLREARRVAAHCVLIKDHNRNGLAAGARLRFMDWVGNARFGVALPYNYWTERQWRAAWHEVGLHPEQLITNLGLYPLPANWIFGAKLHFIARLTKCPSLLL